MVPYQLTTIQLGQWYISELPTAARMGRGDVAEDLFYGVQNTRLVGPFRNEPEARQGSKELLLKHPEYTGRTYIWQYVTTE